jgi:hypothetical protein
VRLRKFIHRHRTPFISISDDTYFLSFPISVDEFKIGAHGQSNPSIGDTIVPDDMSLLWFVCVCVLKNRFHVKCE